MPDPTKYEQSYSFSDWQTANPTKPLPAPRVDDELANISQSIDEIVEAIKDVRRSDGALQNGIVTQDSLASNTDPGGAGPGGGGGGPIAISDVTGLSAALNARQLTVQKNQANGYPTLDGTGKVPTGQLPSFQLTSQKNQANGYAGLDANGKVPAAALPEASGGTAVVVDFLTKAAAVGAEIPEGTTCVRTAGYAAPGDGGGGLYVPFENEPVGPENSKFQDDAEVWWQLAGKNRNVKAFGIVGDGVTDDTAAFQDMVTAGGLIVIPDNTTIRLIATIFVYQPVTIVGAGCVLHKALEESSRNVRGPGSWFFLDHLDEGFNFVGISAPNGTSGIAVQRMTGCGTYRNQPIPSGGTFTPLNASWDIKVTDLELQLDDFVFLNPTRALSAELGRGGRLRLNNIRGQPLTTGISIDKCYDVCHLDVHFWPFWSLHPSVHAHTYANLQALVTGRVDGLLLQRFFCIYANIAWVVRDNGSGSLNRAHADWAYLDNVVKGIVIDSNVNGATIHCNALTVYGRPDIPSIGVQFSGQNVKLTVAFADLTTFQNQAVYLDGNGNRMQIGMLFCAGAAMGGGNVPAAFIGAGNALYIDGNKNFTSVGGQPFSGGTGTLVEPGGSAGTAPVPIQFYPNVSSGAGGVGVLSSAFYYLKTGRLVVVNYDITVDGNNRGDAGLFFSLPFSAYLGSVGAGYNAVDGTMNQVRVVGGDATARIFIYNNGHPIAQTQNRVVGTLSYMSNS